MNFVRHRVSSAIKTVIDYTITIICLILLAPVSLILLIAIKTTTRGAVIYSQKRLGKNGKIFTLYKFRSMYSGMGNGIPLLTGKKDKRITPLGRFMRKHKLDEIPNFINVLKGEMSLVGPRPEQQFYAEKILAIRPDYKLLLEIKPGVTSWGQVRYGYASNVDEMIRRLDYDLCYLQKRSLGFDLMIAFKTIGIILLGEGV